MRGRHKGCRPFERTRYPYDASHPVARMIASGDNWFRAWCFQRAMAEARIARATGMPAERQRAITYGAAITRPELEKLALALDESTDDLIRSIPDKALLVEMNPATGEPIDARAASIDGHQPPLP